MINSIVLIEKSLLGAFRMVFEKKMSVKDLIEQMRKELQEEKEAAGEVMPKKHTAQKKAPKKKAKPVKKAKKVAKKKKKKK